jgi:type VI secretion system secreted protein VgrG
MAGSKCSFTGTAKARTTRTARASCASRRPGRGAQFVPRIGQEVVVDFLEGDPDRPIITGSLYNGANMPPFPLPDNQTQSGIRTRSTPRGTQVNANEIRFEDRIGQENLFIQAERTQTTVVKRDQSVDVGGNRVLNVTGSEVVNVALGRTTTVTLNDTTSVLGESALTVAGDRIVKIAGDASDTIEGSLELTVTGSKSVAISGDLSSNVAGRVDASSQGRHTETFDDDFVSRHAGHRVVVVGGADANASIAVHVEGPATAYAAETMEFVSLEGFTIRCGKSEIRVTSDAITLSSPTLSLVTDDAEIAATKVNAAATDSITLGGSKVTIASSGASVILDSNATVQGAKVQLQGGSGAAVQNADKVPKKTTIKLVDADGKPLANQRVVLRQGGEGGDERTVVLDESGSIVVEGDGPFDALIPDFPDARPS